MTTDADMEYLRNINTRPGLGAGQKIDPTKPGPEASEKAERIAELEREIVHADGLYASCSSQHRVWFKELADDLRAELAQLRNEQSERKQEAQFQEAESAAAADDMSSGEDILSNTLKEMAEHLQSPAPTQGEGSEPVGWNHMFDLLKAARQMACRAVTESGGLDATPRTMLDIAALIGEAEEELLTKPPLYTSPPPLPAGNADPRVREALAVIIAESLFGKPSSVASQTPEDVFWRSVRKVYKCLEDVIVRVPDDFPHLDTARENETLKNPQSSLPSPPSQGLVEAAEWHECMADAINTAQEPYEKAAWHRDCAKALRSRASDRSA